MFKGKAIGYIIIVLLTVGAYFLYGRKSEHPAGNDLAGITTSQVDKLTSEAVVLPYVKKHRVLPEYYIKKIDARKQGWNPAEGNLCQVLPGKAIGGDVFSNREGSLPSGARRKWFEADLNYKCGHRNADRLLYSSDGLIYITRDHYKTFEKR